MSECAFNDVWESEAWQPDNTISTHRSYWLTGRFVCLLLLVGLAVFREKASYLVAVHHEVVSGNQGFEDHHPARVGRPLK